MGVLSGRDSLADLDDRTIARRAADGDLAAFDVLMRRYEALVAAYAKRILSSAADIDDVVQESFIAAWQELPNLQNEGAVKSWLITIVTRKSIDRVRAQKVHDPLDNLDLHDTAAGPEVRAQGSSLEQALTRALLELPDDQRRCWVLREVAGYRYAEIAGLLQLPVSTVRGLLVRSRKTLSRELESWR